MPATIAKKVLLVGWDAADWKHITPLLDRGLLPTIEEFVNDGVMGNLATLEPELSPMLWNSIATGMRPQKHGILGFVEPDPQGRGVRPSASTSRKVKAIWNILTQEGYKTHVVGWFAGHPAEPINGICVSPMLATAQPNKEGVLELPAKTVHPVELTETFRDLRVVPSDLGAAELLPFAPKLREADQEKDKRPGMLAKVLAENASIHNAATWILQHREWDFLAVYYNGIDHFCHGFMQFHPPRMEGIDEKQFEIYRHVIDGAYRYHDMMLHTLLQLAGPETTVILCSDHGFYNDHLRPTRIPKVPAGPAICHRPLGIFAMKGPGIRKDERVYGANLLDITPTILARLGLPLGEDMDGRPILQAFETPPELRRIPSWDEVPGEAGMHPADERQDPAEAKALIDQFVALGYIEKPDENREKAMEGAMRELNFNLARAHVDAGEHSEALPLLEQLVADAPEEHRYRRNLANCCVNLGDLERARELLTGLAGESRDGPWNHMLLGVVEYEQGNISEALDHWLEVEKARPDFPKLHLRLGNAYLRLRRFDDAGRAFTTALEIDDDSPHAHLGAAIVALHRRENQLAAEEAFTAVGIRHFLPTGHYHLGVALVRLGHLDRARVAFETALTMAPGLSAAHRFLAAVYRHQGNLEKFAEHRTRAEELRRRKRDGGSGASG